MKSALLSSVILKAKAINPVTIAVAIELPFLAILTPSLFFSFLISSPIPNPIISSPGANVLGFAIKVFLSIIAGPLEERWYIENISLLTDPIVNTLGRTPGNDIVPKDGPSFPEDVIIIIFWFEAIVIKSIIFSSLKFIPPNDKLIILHLSIKIDSFKASINHSFFVKPELVNIL